MVVLKEKKNEAEFLLKGERHTFPSLLRDALLRDSSVEFAAYKLNHPLDKDCMFFLRTSGKSPKKALHDALKRIDSDLEEFSTKMKKALK